jgi:predicted nucleotidyltransferase
MILKKCHAVLRSIQQLRINLEGVHFLMKQNEKKAVKEFFHLLNEKIGMNLVEVKVFGSKARGEDSPESDIDILVILKQVDKKKRDIITDIAFEVGLKYDLFLSVVVYSQDMFYSPLSKETLFYQNVQREGISIYE